MIIEVTEQLKEQATAYLATRVNKLSQIQPEYYGYCDQYKSSLNNKCLRLIDVISGYCQWPDRLESLSPQFHLSRYVKHCKDVYFDKFHQKIREW